MKTFQRTLQAEVTKAADFNGPDTDVDVRQGTAYLDVTAHSGTNPTLDVKIDEKDETSGKYMELAGFTQVTETDGTTKLDLGAIDTSKLRVRALIGGTTPSYTYTVGFSGKEGDEN